MTLRVTDIMAIKSEAILAKQAGRQLPHHNAVCHLTGIFQDSEPWASLYLPSLPAKIPRFPTWSPLMYEACILKIKGVIFVLMSIFFF